MSKIRMYVGTYTSPIRFGTGQILEGKGKGIYELFLDTESGKLTDPRLLNETVNPSYLVLTANRRFLYAVNELKEYNGLTSGAVSSFAVLPDGSLSFLNQQATLGTDPCHVELDETNTLLFVSNFMSGSISVFPISSDGSLQPCSQNIQHAGSSINPNRQAGPHAHSLIFSPDYRFAFVPDLGIDKLMIYPVMDSDTPLCEKEKQALSVTPGAGPRHCVFDPSGRYCYLINELDCTILSLVYHAQDGRFTLLQSVSSLPENITFPNNTCADVHISPDGLFLYGSNRGHNSLIVYRIDPLTGLLTYSGCQSCGGQIPRNFAIDPTGTHLICANQDSDSIVVFSRDQNTGLLHEVTRTKVPTPVCVRTYLF